MSNDLTYWTITYRRPRAASFKRIKLSLTWKEAYELSRIAAVQTMAEPFQLHITLSAYGERSEARRTRAEVEQGTMSADYAASLAADTGNVMVDSGKRIRIFETGTLEELGLTEDHVDLAMAKVRTGTDAWSENLAAQEARTAPVEQAAQVAPAGWDKIEGGTEEAAPVEQAAPAPDLIIPPVERARGGRSATRAHHSTGKANRRAQRASRRHNRRR